MALLMIKEFPNGAIGQHWKISKIFQDRTHKSLTVTVECFKDATSYLNQMPAIGVEGYIFSDQPNSDGAYPLTQLLADNSVKVGYDLLKALPEFENAIDA